MNLQLSKLFMISLILLVTFSCKKDDDSMPPEPSAGVPVVPFREFKGFDATLQATYYSTRVDSGIIGKITFFQGIGFAAFRAPDGSFTTPGKIEVEGQTLQPKNGVFKSSPGTGQGIDFGSVVEWEVGARGTIPAFIEDIMSPVPEIGDINIKDTIDSGEIVKLIIDTQNPYTTLGTVDSVRYLIVGANSSLRFRDNVLDTVLITPKDLSDIGTGKAYIQTEAFRYQSKSYSGYNVMFVNKGVFNKEVWIK